MAEAQVIVGHIFVMSVIMVAVMVAFVSEKCMLQGVAAVSNGHPTIS